MPEGLTTIILYYDNHYLSRYLSLYTGAFTSTLEGYIQRSRTRSPNALEVYCIQQCLLIVIYSWAVGGLYRNARYNWLVVDEIKELFS